MTLTVRSTPSPFSVVVCGSSVVVAERDGVYIPEYGITIPCGYASDGASIPRFLWWLLGNPLDKPRVFAAIVHDWLYDSHIVSRKRADQIYMELCVRYGVPRHKAVFEYHFIRWFGGGHWD